MKITVIATLLEALLVLGTPKKYTGFAGGQIRFRDSRRLCLYQRLSWIKGPKRPKAPKPQQRYPTGPENLSATRIAWIRRSEMKQKSRNKIHFQKR